MSILLSQADIGRLESMLAPGFGTDEREFNRLRMMAEQGLPWDQIAAAARSPVPGGGVSAPEGFGPGFEGGGAQMSLIGDAFRWGISKLGPALGLPRIGQPKMPIPVPGLPRLPAGAPPRLPPGGGRPPVPIPGLPPEAIMKAGKRGSRYVRSIVGGVLGYYVFDKVLGWIFKEGNPPTRRMNVMNPRALTRANRRICGFADTSTKVLRTLGYSVSSTRSPRRGCKTKGKKRCA